MPRHLISIFLPFLLTPLFAFASYTTDLHQGDIHPDVATLQQYLNTHGYPVTKGGEESTTFGPKTKSALAQFQVDHAGDIIEGGGIMESVGTLNPLTRLYLNQQMKGEVLGATTANFTTNLKQGMTHPEVKLLQQYLNTHGFIIIATGPGSKGSETTYFGGATALALKKYQEKYKAEILIPNGLTQGTGLFYAGTRAHLNKQGGAGTATPTTPVTTTSTTFTRVLFRGASGSDVTALQTLLAQQGYLTAAPSGFFGPATEAALKQYQTAKGLDATGTTGPLTRSRLNGSIVTPPVASISPITTPTPTPVGYALIPASPYVRINSLLKVTVQDGVAPFKWMAPLGEINPIPGNERAIYFKAPSTEGKAVILVTDATGARKTTILTVVSPLSLNAVNADMAPGAKYVIFPAGGAEPYTFTLVTGQGTVTTRGVYTAGTQGIASIRVDDMSGQTQTVNLRILNILASSGGGGGGGPLPTPTPSPSPSPTPTPSPSPSPTPTPTPTPIPTPIPPAPPTTYTLSITLVGSGSITAGSYSCATANCVGTFVADTVLTVVATPSSGYTFASWGGACTGSSTCSITMSQARSLTVNFNTVVVTPPVDTTPPTVPTALTATAVSSSQINLSWTPSVDATGVTGYKIYRGGTQIATSPTNSYSNTGLTASTAYTYTVSAYDAAGNNSAQTSGVSATTQGVVTPPPTSGAPLVLYVDALSGPTTGGEDGNGAYLSIFGKNFYSGAPSGMGSVVKVFIGGVEVANYRYMGPSKVNDVLGIQQITVQVGALGSPTQGTQLPVKVSVSGIDSNTDKTFTPNPGRILFASLSGNDTTAVPGDIAKPYRYLQAISGNVYTQGVFGALRTGDHIVIRGGNWSDISLYDTWLRFTTTYSDSVATPSQASLRGGKAPTGATGAGWVHITAYPGPINGNAIEDVHYSTPAGKKGGIHGPNSAYRGITGDYISISNLRMDVSASATSDAAPLNSQYANGPWRVINNDLGPWPTTALIGYAGGISGSGLKNYQLYGNYIHDIASIPSSLTNHGIYIGDGDGGDIAYNHIARITGGNGFQAADTTMGYPTDNTMIHHNVMHDITKHGVNLGTGVRANNSVYNNLVYNIRQACIRFSSDAITNMKIYNNTCYNTHLDRAASTDPHWSGVGAIMNDGWGMSGIQFDIRNNIFYPLTDTRYIGAAGFSGIATFSNNVFYGGYGGDTATSIDTTKLTTNPLFVSAGSFDFRLQSASPSINAGTSLVSTFVTTDLIAVTRPQGAGFDIGAYEFTGTVTPPVDTTAPAVPTGLIASAVSSSAINLSWTASTDAVGVTGHKVYRGGTQIATVTSGTTYSETGLTASTAYTYAISAYDAAGNNSAQTAGVSATTQGVVTPPTVSGTYYISPSGNDANSCAAAQNINTPKKTIQSVNTCLAPGSAVILRYGSNGIYSGPENTFTNLVNGTAGAYITYKAETQSEGNIIVTSGLSMARTNQYIVIQGLRFQDTGVKVILGQYLKFFKNEFKGGPSIGNTVSVQMGDNNGLPRTKMVLLEDNWIHGYGGRYKILVYNADSIVLRRLVVRHDGTDPITTSNPMGDITVYDSQNVEVQNSIALDDIGGTTNNTYTAAFYNACNRTGDTSIPDQCINHYWRGSISINPANYTFATEGTYMTSNEVMEDIVMVGGKFGISQLNGYNVQYKRLTMYAPQYAVYIAGTPPENPLANTLTTLQDSILINPVSNSFSGITPTNTSSFAPSTIPNPKNSGLSFPTRTESGSTLSTLGRGAQIVSQVGVSGTMYGESGYNTLTSTALWPFPNEVRIKREMCTDVGVTRGFCGTQSLTSYVWEQFGKPCPTEICGFVSATPILDTTAPTVPTGLSATAVSATAINLSWTASTDATGVTGYKVYRGGTQIATVTSGTTYSDTGLTASTAYTYTVSAYDAAGNNSAQTSGVGATTQGVVAVGPTVPPTTIADFSTRCAASGVVKCVGFDNTTSDIVQGVNLSHAGDGVYRGSLDTTIKSSGNGSLRFLLSKNYTSSDLSGSWDSPLGASFGANQTYYVQYRQRFSPEMFSNFSGTNKWNSFWKQHIIYGNTSTCQSVELTAVNWYGSGFPTMYSNCGGKGMVTNLTRTTWLPGEVTPQLLQQGASDTDGYNCPYSGSDNYPAGTGNGTGCFKYPSNTWVTFYYKVRMGAWGQANSTVEAWMSVGGQPYKQWVYVPNFTFDSSADTSFDRIMLTPYMTSLSTPGSADAYTWYDELIVSSQPISIPL